MSEYFRIEISLIKMIKILTFEQEQEIEFYLAKWRTIILSTSEIDKDAATKAIKSAYSFVGNEKPNIVFCKSPYTALTIILEQGLCRLESGVEYYLIKTIWNYIKTQLSQEVVRLVSQNNYKLQCKVNEYKNQIINQVRRQVDIRANQQQKILLRRSNIYIQPEVLASYASKSDFCISVLKCDYDSMIWQVFQLLIQNCGWIISLKKLVNNEKMVIICERPMKLSFDSKYRLHTNDEEPVIQFNDGYSLYSHHFLDAIQD